ncbi:fungal-specific transcription factor domain-containing protein, partial [Dioszegia hungarica]
GEKRGCGQICPVGIIRTGKGGKRLILAETEELHQRISTLELALAASQARHSTQPHPLLEDAYLFSPRDPARPRASASGHAEAGDEEDVVDSAFGTLTIGRSGESRFVGSFAGSEYLRTDHLPDDSNSGLATPPPTAALNSSFDLRLHTARTGPIAPGLRIGGYADGRDVDIVQLRQELPDWEKKGRELVQNCWENVSWMHPIVPQNVFDTQYLQLAYDTQRAIHPHQLAVVYLVMALGVMFDLHRPAFDNRAAELFALGQSCLSAIGFEHATPSTVRALLLCGTYLLNDKHGSGAEIYWPVLGTAIKVAYSLGLHRDGSVFGLSVEETEERRLIWWELITSDRLLATAFARPAGIASRTTDTKMPSVSGAEGDDYQRTRFRIAELMEKINNVQTQLAAVPHTLIKALDAELVEFKKSIPDSLLPSTPIPSLPMDSTISPQLVYHRLTIRLLLAQCRLLLNRPFFARALSENHEDPSFCKHGEPFCALFGAALEIVQVVQQMVVYHPSLVARWWVYWFHAFSSACCFAAIAIRAPKSAFAAPAFDGLTTVLDLATAAPPGCRAKKGLAVLLRLRARAQDSMRKA